MNDYRVDWASTVEQLLASAWLAVPDRGAVTAATAWLDQAMSIAPLRFGVPLDSSVHRVGLFDVLGIEFEVIEDDKRVIVHGVFLVD